MEFVRNTGNAGIVLRMTAVIRENAAYLSEIDGATGDGDHGINMNKGFALAEGRIEEDMTLSEALKILGRTLVMDIGGSMGPIYGTLFGELAKGTKDIEFVTPKTLLVALQRAFEKLKALAGAKPGDKTLLDTLDPAITAYGAAIAAGKSYADALTALAEGAERGKESTKDMAAKIGRAARLGERSRGFLDAGATSCAIVLQTLAAAMAEVIVRNPE